MSLTDLILFLLSSAGLTIIVTKSYIFKPVRDFFDVDYSHHHQDFTKYYTPTLREKASAKVYKLLSCPLCFGFWAGLIMNFILFNNEWNTVLALAFSSSIFSFITYSVVER